MATGRAWVQKVRSVGLIQLRFEQWQQWGMSSRTCIHSRQAGGVVEQASDNWRGGKNAPAMIFQADCDQKDKATGGSPSWG